MGQQKKSYNLRDAFELGFESATSNLVDFDDKVNRSEQQVEKLSDVELEHKAEKVKTVKMMKRTVKFFLEIIAKKVKMRKIKIGRIEKLKRFKCKQLMDEARKIYLSVIISLKSIIKSTTKKPLEPILKVNSNTISENSEN